MNLRLPGIEHDFECDNVGYVNSIVIENPKLFCVVLMDMEAQLQGDDGKTVLSEDNKIIALNKYLELHSCFIPFHINQKGLVNKIIARLDENAIAPEHYIQSSELVSEIERYCMELSVDLMGNIDFPKIAIENIIKAAGPEIADDYDSLAEKLIDYFELVKEYDRNKLFVLINLRSFLAREELQIFINEVLMRNIQILLIDSMEYPLLENEKRYLVDDSICEIC